MEKKEIVKDRAARTAAKHWTECRTLGELGDGERPSVMEWLRHLALGPARKAGRGAGPAA